MPSLKAFLKKILPVRASTFASYREGSLNRLNSIDARTTAIDKRLSIIEKHIRDNMQEWRSYTRGYDFARRCLPEERANEIRRIYRDRLGKDLDLDNPVTYNEKMQYRKLHDSRAEEKALLTDKLRVREWVESKIGSRYLVPMYGAWKSFDEIDFDLLPDRFVLKANHGSGMTIVVRNRDDFSKDEARCKFEKWLNTNFAYSSGFEMHYEYIKPCIIAEKLLENNEESGNLYDYKFWCFSGDVKFIQFSSERQTKEGLKMAFLDTDWNTLPFSRNEYPLLDEKPERPDNLEEMIRLAEKLASDFDHVRVDFYDTPYDGIKFGEMTFSTNSGYCEWNPEETDEIVGRLWELD